MSEKERLIKSMIKLQNDFNDFVQNFKAVKKDMRIFVRELNQKETKNEKSSSKKRSKITG